MKKKTNPVSPLLVLAREIEEKGKGADDHWIAAAMSLRVLRARIEAGEAGNGVKWFEWAPKNIKLSVGRIYELQTIAEAPDPKAKLEQLRRMNRERVKKSRDKKKALDDALEDERREVAAWARKAPLEDVLKIWRQIKGKGTVVPLSAKALKPANHEIENAA